MQSRGHAYTQFLADLTIDSTLVAASSLQNNLGVGKNLLQLSSLTSREIFGEDSLVNVHRLGSRRRRTGSEMPLYPSMKTDKANTSLGVASKDEYHEACNQCYCRLLEILKSFPILPSHPIVRASLYLSCMLHSVRTGPRTESHQICPTNPASVSQSRGPENERYCRWALTSPHRTHTSFLPQTTRARA